MPQKEIRPKTAQSLGQRSVCIPTTFVRKTSSALRNHQKPLSLSPSRLNKLSISRSAHSEVRLPNAPWLTQTPTLLIPFAQITALFFYHRPHLRLLPVRCIRVKGRAKVKRQDQPVNGQSYRRIRVMMTRAAQTFT